MARIFQKVLILGWVLSCVVAVAPCAKAADPPPPLDILTRPSHHLLGQGSRLSASLAFRWRGDLIEEGKQPPSPTIAFVQFGELDPQALAQASGIEVVKREETSYLWLEISIDLGSFNPLQRHGTYIVGIEGLGKDDELIYEQTLSLTRTKSTLADPADLLLEQKRLWPLWTGPLVGRPLRVATASGPPPAQIRILEEGQTKIGTRPAFGRLGHRETCNGEQPAPVEPLQDLVVNDLDPLIGASVELGVLSSFDLGEATGSLKITSPDADPVTVGYTLTTRQPRGLIWFIAALGLLLGFLVRVFWVHRIERNRALLRLDGLKREIMGLRDRYKSRTFEDTLTQIAADLEDVEAKLNHTSKPEEVTELLTEVDAHQAKIEPAVSAAETQRTQIQTRLTQIQESITATWSLPKTLTEALKEAQSRLVEIGGLLQDRDLDKADKALSTTAKSLADEVATRTQDWKRALEIGLVELQQEPSRPLPPVIAQQLATAVDEVDETFVPDSPSGKDKERIEASLTQAHQVMEKTRDLISELGRALGGEIRNVEKILAAASPVQNPTTLAVLEGVIDGLRKIDGSRAPSVPSTGFSPLVTRISKALEATAEAIREEIRHSGAAPIVEKKLDSGSYAEAAAEALTAPRSGKTKIATLTSSSLLVPAGDAPWYLSVREPVRASSVLVRKQPEVPDWWQIDPWRLRREIAWTTFLRFLVIGIGLAFVAFLLFGDSFIGTPADWGKILLWGFTTDIAADALVAQTEKTLR